MTYLQNNKNYGDLDDDNYKAVLLQDPGNGVRKADSSPFLNKSLVSSDAKASPDFSIVQSMGVWSLALVSNFPVVFSFLTEWLKTQGIDFNAPTSNHIYGYLFERNDFTCFKLELSVLKQKDSESPIIQLYRLQGDGFLLEEFFQKLKTGLETAGHCLPETGDNLDDDLDELFDDVFESEGFTLSNYLNLSFDPAIVLAWCSELVSGQHIEDVLHVLLLLAYNGENTENLDVFLQQKQQIVNALFKLLKIEENCMSLPVARSIAKVLSQLCSRKRITLTWEQVEILGSLLIGWSEQKAFNHANPVTYSEEIQSNLAQTLSSVGVDKIAPRNARPVLEKLTNLAQSTNNQTINSHLKNFVQSIAVC